MTRKDESDIIFIFQGDICTMTLDEVHVNQSAVITKVGGEGVLRGRLLDMGLIPKTAVRLKNLLQRRLRGLQQKEKRKIVTNFQGFRGFSEETFCFLSFFTFV